MLFVNSVLRPFQDYFSSYETGSYETGQSVGGAKTGEPREKPPDTPASRTWLVSHVARAGLEPTPDTAVRQVCIKEIIMQPARYESADDHIKSAKNFLRKRVIALFVITFSHIKLSESVFVIIKYVLLQVIVA